MAQPEPDMSDSEESKPREESDAPPEPPPAPKNRRPDWLVGAEDGAVAEMNRARARASGPALKLVRPGDAVPDEGAEGGEPAEGDGPEPLPRITLMRPDENARSAHLIGKPLPPRGRDRTSAWTAAASSIPTLRRTSAPAPTVRGASRPDHGDLGGGDEEDPLANAEPDENLAPPSAPRVVLPPLREAWWTGVLDAIQTSRKIQIAAGALVLVLLAIWFWPSGEPSVSLSSIRRHPTQFDGHTVTLHGRVGDIYPIAGGFTYYLRQGRDTIVVFTHGRAPVSDQTVTVHGTISTGYLDGLPRQALFEESR